jgi:hypothetical protein
MCAGARVCVGAGIVAVVFGAGLARPGVTASGAMNRPVPPDATFTRRGWNELASHTVNLVALDLALRASSCAVKTGLVDKPSTLTLIDYSRRSVDRRLWVFDLVTGRVLHQELVAHGRGSGADRATAFSNLPESHQSSLGLFATADTYVGRNGYSLRLDGLDRGFNDRARERAIVMHGAPYVSEDVARTQGRLGRSLGCPALRDAVARRVIDRIKGGNLVFAYYPDERWLKSSELLGDCSS